jgi:hypothetical protein
MAESVARRMRYNARMEKFATADEVLAQIRRMSVEDREYVAAELMRDAYESGRLAEPDDVMDEVIRRAHDALRSSDPGLTREQSITGARLAVQQARQRRS